MLRVGTQKLSELRIGTQKIKEAWVGATKVFSSGVPISTLPVGSSVFMKVNNVLTEFLVVHQGNPNANIYPASFNNGTILLMKNVYDFKRWNYANTNDYANSELHSYLNNNFITLFDSKIQSVIKQVKIPFRAGAGTSTAVTSGDNGLSAKIFLLSMTEVGLSESYQPTNEGAKLDYFYSTTLPYANAQRVAYRNGGAEKWWLRSPYCTYQYSSFFITESGGYNNDVCTATHGIRPALVLPNSVTVDVNNIIQA